MLRVRPHSLYLLALKLTARKHRAPGRNRTPVQSVYLCERRAAIAATSGNMDTCFVHNAPHMPRITVAVSSHQSASGRIRLDLDVNHHQRARSNRRRDHHPPMTRGDTFLAQFGRDKRGRIGRARPARRGMATRGLGAVPRQPLGHIGCRCSWSRPCRGGRLCRGD
jgi:hypothetical protein